MNMKNFLIISFTLLFSNYIFSQEMLGKELLEKSIEYHDPKGNWEKGKFTFRLKQDMPQRGIRFTTFKIDHRKEVFWQKDEIEKDVIIRQIEKDSCEYELNGKKTFTAEESKKHHLNCERTKMWRDYQTYLYGLPMKLKDQGTIIHEKIEKTTFQDKPCWKLKVTYEATVGKDTWYFYFSPENYSLIGYRFYKDESKNDGEFITLEDEIIINEIKFPRDRKWYFNIDGNYLATDYILSGK